MASKETWLLQNTENRDVWGLGSMDVTFDQGGRLVELVGVEKLRMLLIKCLLTGRYTEEDNSYGSTIPRLLGQKQAGSSELVKSLYMLSVAKALESFRVAQPGDLDITEAMAYVDGEIQVSRDKEDRTVLLIGVAVRNLNDDTIAVVHAFPSY